MDERGCAPQEGGAFLKSIDQTLSVYRGPTRGDHLHIDPTLSESAPSFISSSAGNFCIINLELSIKGNYFKFKLFISRKCSYAFHRIVV